MFFVPVVMSLIVVTIIFQRILEPNAGLLNTFLRSVGLDALAHPWLGDPDHGAAGRHRVSVWKNVGFSLVILLAGLQGLPRRCSRRRAATAPTPGSSRCRWSRR